MQWRRGVGGRDQRREMPTHTIMSVVDDKMKDDKKKKKEKKNGGPINRHNSARASILLS